VTNTSRIAKDEVVVVVVDVAHRDASNMSVNQSIGNNRWVVLKGGQLEHDVPIEFSKQELDKMWRESIKTLDL
jgi:hypothetical protein